METELRNFPSQQDALEEFTRQWNSGVYNDTLEMQLWDLFEQAESCGNEKDAAVYYHKILALEPDNVDAKRELISHIDHKGKRIIEIEALIQSLQKPRKLDWLVAETCPYTRCLIDLAGYYVDCGCYDEAIATYIPVFHGDKNNRSHFLIHMMVACCGAADWKQGQKVFKRYLDSTDDFQSMMTTPVDMTLCIYCIFSLVCSVVKANKFSSIWRIC